MIMTLLTQKKTKIYNFQKPILFYWLIADNLDSTPARRRMVP